MLLDPLTPQRFLPIQTVLLRSIMGLASRKALSDLHSLPRSSIRETVALRRWEFVALQRFMCFLIASWSKKALSSSVPVAVCTRMSTSSGSPLWILRHK